jgi:riboflavin synthase
LTTLGHKGVGAPVNLEVDVLAKYVERLLPFAADGQPRREESS